MKIHRYRPAFFEGYPNESAEVTTKEDLLNIEWIKQWAEPAKGDVFFGFMVSECRLMATFNFNTNKEPSWYVVATLDKEAIPVVSKWFPKMEYPYYIMKNGDKAELTCVCGPRVTLRINDNEVVEQTAEWFKANMENNVFPGSLDKKG